MKGMAFLLSESIWWVKEERNPIDHFLQLETVFEFLQCFDPDGIMASSLQKSATFIWKENEVALQWTEIEWSDGYVALR